MALVTAPEALELRDFLARIQAGDECAAAELLRVYEPEVRLVVRRQLPRLLRSRFDSLDFLQSVWASFFRQVRDGRALFDDARHLIAFLAAVARNKVVDEFRRSSTQKYAMHRELPLSDRAAAGVDPPALLADPRDLAEMRDEFARLRTLVPASRRGIFDLKAQGLSNREIGERLGLSERTVERVFEDLRRRASFLDPEPD